MSIKNYEQNLMRKFKGGDKKAIDEVVTLFSEAAAFTCEAILVTDRISDEEIKQRTKVFIQDMKTRLYNNYSHYDNFKDIRVQLSLELKLVTNTLSSRVHSTCEMFRSCFDKVYDTIEQMPVTQNIFTRYFFTKIEFEILAEKFDKNPMELADYAYAGLSQLDDLMRDKNEKQYFLLLSGIRKN